MLAIDLALALALAACAGDRSPREQSDTTSPGTSIAASPAAEPERRDLDWCALPPLQEVSATLQRTVGKTVNIAKPSAGGGCTYRDVEQGAPEMQLLIETADVGSDSAAAESMKVVRGMFADRGQAVTDVVGVGDAAFGAWEAETYGLKLRKGHVTGAVNVNARRFQDPAVEQAARELAKQMVAKLP
ncbi:MAG: hypothetical protein HOQ11_02225 [Gemmatimonadaceae bacterium]|nr:hypothetical protein [Gemmatimonadaceae bacterium]NUS96205.1 hypothetical protein [Gemmatimonadaceae bacterium]